MVSPQHEQLHSFLRMVSCEKDSLHLMHLKGVSPVCILRCFLRLEFCEKPPLHWLL